MSGRTSRLLRESTFDDRRVFMPERGSIYERLLVALAGTEACR